jgi:hypothetical protein
MTGPRDAIRQIHGGHTAGQKPGRSNVEGGVSPFGTVFRSAVASPGTAQISFENATVATEGGPAMTVRFSADAGGDGRDRADLELSPAERPAAYNPTSIEVMIWGAARSHVQ